jgi:hypothetical protein
VDRIFGRTKPPPETLLADARYRKAEPFGQETARDARISAGIATGVLWRDAASIVA